MWVRLIGGLNDGEVEKIDDDQVEVIKRKSFPGTATRVVHGTFGITPHSCEVKSTRYTRRLINTSGGNITFFAVEGFSDFDALNHVLGP
jgi:hypothetical protein